jgi:DNA-binding response OmpR family regulator
MLPPELLIVEDDAEMAAILTEGFERDNYRTTVAHDGLEGLRLASGRNFRALVLDLMLPMMDGFEVARELRRAGNRTPILLLTARDSVADKVLGLDSGAEDYLTKPFSFLELSARVRALIRRQQPPSTNLRVGCLEMNTATHDVTREGRPVALTRTEYQILEILMRNAGHVVRRRDLAAPVWGPSVPGDGNHLDVVISGLRSKVDRDYQQKLIRTVRGFGYRIGPCAE